jgi:hypothetical protein
MAANPALRVVAPPRRVLRRPADPIRSQLNLWLDNNAEEAMQFYVSEDA